MEEEQIHIFDQESAFLGRFLTPQNMTIQSISNNLSNNLSHIDLGANNPKIVRAARIALLVSAAFTMVATVAAFAALLPASVAVTAGLITGALAILAIAQIILKTRETSNNREKAPKEVAPAILNAFLKELKEAVEPFYKDPVEHDEKVYQLNRKLNARRECPAAIPTAYTGSTGPQPQVNKSDLQKARVAMGMSKAA